MIKGFTNNGEMKDVKVDENGVLQVSMGAEVDENGALQVSMGAEVDENGAMKVSMETTSDKEVVLNSSILTIGTVATIVQIGKRITNIMVANYSENAVITITAGTKTLQVGSNLALELPVNLELDNLSIVSNVADTKIQLVIKGVE